MKKLLKTYTPFSKAAVQQHMLAYPLETFMYFAGMTIGIFVVYYIWKVIYETGNYNVLEGFTLNEMIGYIILSFGVMQATDNGTVWIIADEVRSGSIIMNLIKPINYHVRIFFEIIGITIFISLVILLPSTILIKSILNIGGLINWGLFFVSLMLGVIIGFLFDFIFGMMAFYVKNLWGIGFGKFALVRLLSGALIPLAFFPDAVQKFLNLLPFKAIVYTPIMIFLGKFSTKMIIYSMFNQLFWIAVLMLINYLIWKKAITRLTVQGG